MEWTETGDIRVSRRKTDFFIGGAGGGNEILKGILDSGKQSVGMGNAT